MENTKVAETKMADALEKIAKTAVYFLVFILPLFFLPWTADVLDFNKQTLLIFLVFISLLCFLLKSLIEGKINLNFSLLNLPVFIFLVVLAVATLLSASPYSSFWGWSPVIGPSFLTVLGFVLLYFLIVNLFQKEEVLGLLLIFVVSNFLAIIFGILQIFGKFLLPFDFSKNVSFNTIGAPSSLAVYVAGLLILISSLILISRGRLKILFFPVILAGFCLLFLINFWLAWFVLLIGAVVILTFGISRQNPIRPRSFSEKAGRTNETGIFQASWLALPMFFLLVGLFFGVFKISLPGLPNLPGEAFLPQGTSFNIVLETLKEKTTRPFFGSGPATFIFGYSKFKPIEINQTPFWGIRFAAPASEILDKLATTGILGLLSFLAIIGVFIFLALCWLAKQTRTAFPWIFGLGIFASWLAVTAALFFYSFNFSLGFLFWFLTACFIVLIEPAAKSWWGMKSFTLEPSSLAAVGASFAFILLLILGIGLLFLSGQRYIAELRYLQATRAVQRGNSQEAVDFLSSAISHTGAKQDNYFRDLAQVYLFRINEELNNASLSQEEMTQRVSGLIANGINSAVTATNLGSGNVANWMVRGFVYYNLINLIGGAEEWAIKSYQEAGKLEPANPFIYTQIGRAYLFGNDLDKAREQFQKSLDLKSDYAPAHFQMALIYVRENKIAQAIEKMEETKRVVPDDVGLAFQLGLLYYNDNQFDRARAEFERAVGFDPNYSNARYFLGLIYDREGRSKEAISQFEKIEQFNPDNEEVKKILANLRAGKPALEGVVPGQPPIEEKPAEQL